MSEDIQNPTSAYPVNRDSQIVTDVVTRSSKARDQNRTVGIILEKEGDETEEGRFGGRWTFKYYIYSHHKRIPSKKLKEDPNSRLQQSLLYTTYSNENYEKYQRVLIVKKASHIEIVHKLGKPVEDPFEFVEDDDLCEIKLGIKKEKKYYNENDEEVKFPFTTNASGELTQVPKKTAHPREEIQITIEANTEKCPDSYLTKVQDEISSLTPSSTQSPENVEVYKGYIRGNEKVVLARKLKAGTTHFGGVLKVGRNDVTLPIQMEKSLKSLAAKIKKEFEVPLVVNSIFRTHSHQTKLHNKYIDESSTSAPAARPGYSKHQSGNAIDFDIILPSEKSKWPSVYSFTYEQYENKEWPEIFRYLTDNSNTSKFYHPSWAKRKKSFEGWHWEYTG